MPIKKLVERHFTKHKLREDKDSDGFSCSLVDDTPAGPKGKNLKNSNAKAWPVLVFDFDEGETSYEDVARKLQDDGIAFIGYSSFNHMRAKDDAAPVAKFRIVVFLSAPYVLHDVDELERAIRVSTYHRAYHAVAAHYGFRVDPTCSNPARLFYLPAHADTENANKHAFINRDGYDTGVPFDFNKFVVVARAAVVAERAASEKRKAEKAAKRAKTQERKASYETSDLDRFVQDCGPSCDAKQFILDYGDDAAQSATGAVQAVCPHQDGHSGGADNRLTLFAFNAGDPDGKAGEHTAPLIGCNHATCTATITTWGFVDLICQANGLTVETLLLYVPDDVRETFKRNENLPRGFRRKSGRIEGQTLGNDPMWLDLCRNFEIGPRVHDEKGAGWGTEISFKNYSGADVTEVILARDLQKDEAELRAHLSDLGLDVSTVPAAKPLFISCLNRLQPSGTCTNFSRPGWHETAYVTAMAEVIPADHTESFSGRLDAQRAAPVRAKSGTREAFNKGVLGKLVDPRLYHFQLGILIGCAGPLMKLLRLDPRLLYLGGASKRGKTTTQELSVAVWASPRRGDGLLFACKSTANGLEALLARGRDQTTALDELRQLDEKARQSVVFDLASGHGKSRMTKNLEMQRPITWDSQIITLSGEQSASQLLGDKGRVAGEVVRMPNIDVGTLKPHDDPRYVKSIGQAARDNFGWLGPDVVRTIIKLGYRDDPTPLRTIYDTKLGLLVKSNAATQHEAASVFALLWTAGEVLQKAKLVPDDWNIEAAVRWACNTFNDSSEAQRMKPMETAREALFSYLLANPSKFPFTHAPRDVGYQGADGWRDNDVYYILAAAFERIVGAHTNVLSYKRWAADQGYLQKKGKNLQHQRIPDVGLADHVRIVVPTDATERSANVDPPNLIRAQWRFRHRRRVA